VEEVIVAPEGETVMMETLAKIVGCKLGELTNPTGVHTSMVKKSVAAIVLQ
jgi:hypothetical protein